jgi:hypothetical protein
MEISKDKLKSLFIYFKMENNPRSDGWIVGFYLWFYNMLEDELPKYMKLTTIFQRIYHEIEAFCNVVPKHIIPS